MKKLDVQALALSLGIIWSASCFLLAIVASSNGFGLAWINLIASIYHGYQPGLNGAIVGAIWGFFDFAIFGALIAWLYNKFAQ